MPKKEDTANTNITFKNFYDHALRVVGPRQMFIANNHSREGENIVSLIIDKDSRQG